MTPQRLDVISIFPGYLAPLGLSLLGRAQEAGLLSVQVHDLRAFTSDRHHTVDDTPYGGGAGMVMRPEPWGKALDAVLATGAEGAPPALVVPTPAGAMFTQATAAELAERPWLVFACGRYEGIDQRVVDHYADRVEVRELSVGDYVLGGGEAAALVIIEAVARLLPGFVGNPGSLAEESHSLGAADLLEYPVYTKPPSWRGIDVPNVLLSGHHGEIAAWRYAEAVRRTARRRPDLAHPSQTLDLEQLERGRSGRKAPGRGGPGPAGLDGAAEVRLAEPSDAPALLVLQRCCWVGEAQLNDDLFLPPLTETLDDVRRSFTEWQTFVVRAAGRLVASVRGKLTAEADRAPRWDIGRLMVAPDLTGRGLGSWLLAYIERAAPPEATSYQLVTGPRSEQNLRMYRKAGYRRVPTVGDQAVVTLAKPVSRRPALPP